MESLCGGVRNIEVIVCVRSGQDIVPSSVDALAMLAVASPAQITIDAIVREYKTSVVRQAMMDSTFSMIPSIHVKSWLSSDAYAGCRKLIRYWRRGPCALRNSYCSGTGPGITVVGSCMCICWCADMM